MAVYRESKPPTQSRIAVLAGILSIIVAIIVILIVVVGGSGSFNSKTATPNLAIDSSLVPAYSKISDMVISTQLFGIEYGKISSTVDKSQTGAPGAIDKALADYVASEADLLKLDVTQTKLLKKDLDDLKSDLDLNPPDPNKVINTVSDANQHLSSLVAGIKGTNIAPEPTITPSP